MKIKFLLTGGTFDKVYNELTAQLELVHSNINEMLKVSRTTCAIIVEQLVLKDSLDNTAKDRKAITNACKKTKESRIVITHGTDTMAETALAIKKAGLSDKTVVLTGAMIPYSFGTKSDAMFNLGNALGFVQVLPPGVYIAMNGQYFEAGNVRKNKEAGIFIKK